MKRLNSMHNIRLRGPWTRSNLAGDSHRISVPEFVPTQLDAKSESDLQTYIYERNFNLPTGLNDSSRVYLRLEKWVGKLERVSVNGIEIDRLEQGPTQIDISSCLQPHNRIQLTISDRPEALAQVDGEVSLVILEQDETRS